MALEEFMGLEDDDEDLGGGTYRGLAQTTGGRPKLGPLGAASAKEDPGLILRGATMNLLSRTGPPKTGLDLLRDYAMQYLPDQEELARVRGRAYDAYETQAQAVEQQSPAMRAAPWLAFSAGMGAPTRFGSFQEGAAKGAGELSRALEQQAGRDALAQREAAILRTRGPELRAKELGEDMRTSMNALSRITSAEKGASGVRFKYEKSGRNLYIYDNHQIDPATGGPKLVQKIEGDNKDILSKFATGLMRIAGDPARMKFDSPAQMMDWVRERTSELGKNLLGPEATPQDLSTLVDDSIKLATPPTPPAPASGTPPIIGGMAPVYSESAKAAAVPPATIVAGAGATPQKITQDVLNSPQATAQDREAVLGALAGQQAPVVAAQQEQGLATQNQRELARVPPPAPPLPPQPVGLSPVTQAFIPPKVVSGGPKMIDRPEQEGQIATAREEAKNAEETYMKEVIPGKDVGFDMLGNAKLWRTMGDETSRAAAMQEWMGGWMQAAGLDNKMVKKATRLQQLNKIMMQEVLRQQILQKGVQTEGDAKRMVQAWAQIQNTPEANEFILRLSEAKSSRLIERAHFYDAYRESHGTLRGASGAWNKYVKSAPLVGLYKGRPVFYNEWLERAQRANPNVEPGVLHNEWRKLARD